jgi:hypothetical protein
MAELLARHQADELEQKLRLQLHHDEFFIEHDPERRQVCVTYVTGEGDEPEAPYRALEVRLAIDAQEQWIPYHIHRPSVGTRIYGAVHPTTHFLTVTDAANQRALARYCDTWSFYLRDQGWYAQAVKLPYAETAGKMRSKWPEPTVERPAQATLDAWLWAGHGCEASDGCWTNLDGTCPHNHPSWLLRLEQI